VALAKSLSVADDRVVAADRTTPRQKDQRDRSGVDVVFRVWQCDKKNQGWREGPPLTVPCQSFDLLPGLHPPVKSVSIEKRILLYVGRREAHNQNFGRFKTTFSPSAARSAPINRSNETQMRIAIQTRVPMGEFQYVNNTNLALPDSNVDSGTAGKIFDVASPMRNMQFALKLKF
jgi:hypothetical protein